MIKLPDGRVLYMTHYHTRAKAKLRRAERKAQNRCINDTSSRSHGPPVDGGVRCRECKKTHSSNSE